MTHHSKQSKATGDSLHAWVEHQVHASVVLERMVQAHHAAAPAVRTAREKKSETRSTRRAATGSHVRGAGASILCMSPASTRPD
eukprot:274217-Chlamydomonas_euryale.AAC.2